MVLDWHNGWVADVSSALKNALSYGYPTSHGLQKDTPTLIAIQHVTRAIVQLGLLVTAGSPPGQAMVDLLRTNDHYGRPKNQALINWETTADAMKRSTG